MTICVIGNSHAGVIRKPWPAERRPARFFCAAGKSLQTLRLEGSSLVTASEEVIKNISMTSGGFRQIDLPDYDAFILVGLQLGTRELQTVYATHRLVSDAEPDHFVISDACFEETFADMVRTTIAADLATAIRSVCDRPILLVPEPNPPEQYAQGRPLWQSPAINQLIAARFAAASRQLAETLDAVFVPQPEGTLASGMTRADHCKFATQIARGETIGMEGMLHTNDAFGQLLVDQIEAALDSTSRHSRTMRVGQTV